MSTDYFLVTFKKCKKVMIGSSGFSGVSSFTGEPDVVEFIRWVIEEGIDDVAMVSEHELDEMFTEIPTFEFGAALYRYTWSFRSRAARYTLLRPTLCLNGCAWPPSDPSRLP